MKNSNKGLLAACSLGCLMLASTFTGATETPAAGASAPTMQELDEVISYAKRLEERIFDREQRFYARYNVLNDDASLDVTCDFWWKDELMQGFRAALAKRGCVPAFFAESQRSKYRRAVLAGLGASSNCPSFRTAATTTVTGGIFVDDEGRTHLEYYNVLNLAPPSGSCYPDTYTPTAPDAELAWHARYNEFRTNLVRVVSSDEELQSLAADLDSLIDEGNASRQRAAEARHAKWVEVRCVVPPAPRGGSRTGCSR